MFMSKRVLLVGRNQTVLAKLAKALAQEDIDVQTTNHVEQASQDFNARDFSLIAFGRGVDGTTKDRLKADFTSQNPNVLFVDGIAPIIPLLVKQVIGTLKAKPADSNVLTQLGYEQHSSTVHLTVRQDCYLSLCFYQLDAVHRTRHETLIAENIQTGSHMYHIKAKRLDNTIASFLLIEVNEDELAILPLT